MYKNETKWQIWYIDVRIVDCVYCIQSLQPVWQQQLISDHWNVNGSKSDQELEDQALVKNKESALWVSD